MDLSLLAAGGVLEGMVLVQEMRVEVLKVHRGILRVEGAWMECGKKRGVFIPIPGVSKSLA